jgi:exonuclease SbcD
VIKILHFADAHIDIANHGRQDPNTGFPLRVMDFLKALDTIVDTAVERKVDLVIFAGDAYRDRTPVPTFQREWGRRILRLSQAGIQTILLVGNHDLSPSLGRAHAMQEFDTLEIAHVHVIDKPRVLHPSDLEGLPLQVMALPWLSRSRLAAAQQEYGIEQTELSEKLTGLMQNLVEKWFEEQIDPSLPVVLTAHGSVEGAEYGFERNIMLGGDMTIPPKLAKDPRLDYTALGHIHKRQDLNPDARPPVIYPGSIERVDFGEVRDDKYFVIVTLDNVKRDRAAVEWIKLHGRRFIDTFVRIDSAQQDVMDTILTALRREGDLTDAMVRLVIEYPREAESMIDQLALRRETESACEFHLVRRPQMEARLRLAENVNIASLTPLELLEKYWHAAGIEDDLPELNRLAAEILSGSQTEEE